MFTVRTFILAFIWFLFFLTFFFIGFFAVVHVGKYRNTLAASHPVLNLTCSEYLQNYRVGDLSFAGWNQEMLRRFQISGTVEGYSEESSLRWGWTLHHVSLSDGTATLNFDSPVRVKIEQRLSITFRMWRSVKGFNSVIKIVDQQTGNILYDDTEEFSRLRDSGLMAGFPFAMSTSLACFVLIFGKIINKLKPKRPPQWKVKLLAIFLLVIGSLILFLMLSS